MSGASPKARPLRVLHAPTGIGSHPQTLARAERALGLLSRCLAFKVHAMQARPDEILFRDNESRFRWEIRRWSLLLRALRDYDVIHFNGGASFMPVSTGTPQPGEGQLRFLLREAYARLLHFRDLPLLRRFGKAVFVTYQGSDARQQDYCRRHFRISAAGAEPDLPEESASDEARRRGIARAALYADRIYALNPDLLHVLPRRARFLPYASLDLGEVRPKSWPRGRGRLRIVHAPSRRGLKGTAHVIEAVNKLAREGAPVEFQLLEGRSRSQILEALGRADLVVDQLLVGWYGGLALEAMALGRPVVAYIRGEDLAFVPGAMARALPIIRAEPATLLSVLRSWMRRRRDLPALGRRSRSYVERWHDPLKVAASLKADYQETLRERGLL